LLNSKSKVIKLLVSLETAIRLEHSTLPPYLYAYWSIEDLGSPLALSIYEVIKEEMLHMALACNILNAIGGSPDFSRKDFIPDYPTALPAHDMMIDPFVVGLNKLDIKAIVTFLHIELPRDLGTYSASDNAVDTIGEFYAKIRGDLELLPDEEFQGGKQLAAKFAPRKSGNLFEISSQTDALRAVDEIVEQGEGLSAKSISVDDSENHFNRFKSIYRDMGGLGKIHRGRFDAKNLVDSVDENAYSAFQSRIKNIVADPKQNNIEAASIPNTKFNSAYSVMLDALTVGFNMAEPDLDIAIQQMCALTKPALEVMSIPVDKNDLSRGYCGPTFEYIFPNERLF